MRNTHIAATIVERPSWRTHRSGAMTPKRQLSANGYEILISFWAKPVTGSQSYEEDRLLYK